jgi:Fungal Transforming acidic coiled-coil (TACC) proteins
MPPTLISLDLFDSMSRPLTALSASKQNTPKSPLKSDFKSSYTNNHDMTTTFPDSLLPDVETPTEEEFHDTFSVAPDTPRSVFNAQDGTVIISSPAKRPSPVKATLFSQDATTSIPEDFEVGTVVVKSPAKRMSPVKNTLFGNIEPTSEEPEAEDGTVVVRSPVKRMSPIKNTLFDDAPVAEEATESVGASPSKRQASSDEPASESQREHSGSPTSSPRPAMRFNEGLTKSMQQMKALTKEEDERSMQRNPEDELMSRIYNGYQKPTTPSIAEDETEITLNGDDKTCNDLTVGDLSTISAIPADMTRFANLRNSPTKTPRPDAWSPSKQLRNSVIMGTPGTSQRPLHLLSASRNSISSNEDEEATPRRPQSMFNDSPTDLLNFTGQSNVHIPPPGSAPRSSRRTPSGRGAFPIRVNPSPSHRSQASVDRQAAAGNISPQKSYFPPPPQATPAGSRKSQYGLDLLDIDLEPMATPRSIPTVTPRELEELRSSLQSRISGLEATLSGKEAEVSALKRAITDAEVRVGKSSEELRNERASKEDLEHKTAELEKRSREMEEVLREVKQNAFVEEREREKLRREKEEVERRCEERDVKVLELTASLDTLRDQRIMSTPSPQKHSRSPSKDQFVPQTPGGSIDIDTAVKNATENVARELHALYKGKHERKVADLKTSYERRWQKQVSDLREQLRSSQDEVEALRTAKDATMSGVVPNAAQAAKLSELSKENEALAAAKGILDAKVAGLDEQLITVKVEAGSLRKELEQERVEKGELVAQVDLFLAMSAEQEAAKKIPLPESPPESTGAGEIRDGYAPSPSKPSTRLSINGGLPKPARPMSMLKAPTKYSALPQPGNKTPARGMAARGGILEGIARMGAGGR